MFKLKSFDKLVNSKKKPDRNVWIILSVFILVVTIVIFASYAKYLNISKEVAITNSTIGDFYYREDLLNGTEPVLTDNLIPVTISDTGSVAKADLYSEWYKYEDKKWANAVKLFEKEVTTIKDSSGNGNDGTVYGNLVEGYGYASFDGTDDYIDTGVGSGYEFGNNYAIALKFVYTVNQDQNIRLFVGSGLDVFIRTNGGFASSFVFSNDNGGLSYNAVNIDAEYFEESKIYDFLIVYDGVSLNIYSDGELIQSVSATEEVKTKSTTMVIGSGYLSDLENNFYNGKIYYASVSSDSLTENEINDYYKNDELSNKEDLLFEYKFYDVYDEDMTDIVEDNIESYFVWIPKYSYQLFDLGNYNGETSIENKEQTINVRFGKKNTSDGVIGECATPGVAGESGNCVVGDYMTHPAFLAFDTNGLWVGKFETGYEGATTKDEAKVNESDIKKVIIKPNVYSWRSATIGNMFKTSYEYDRNNDSHMMKNTEWGAVAYLSHSDYGINDEVRINNNSSYITGYSATVAPTIGYNSGVSVEGNRVESTALNTDGTYTVNYLNNSSVISSTTGNYTGIYDMSGGAWEYVMGYTTGASTIGGSSEILTLYEDFYTNSNYEKYYDKYSSTSKMNYTNRILGDVTGEMGPFLGQLDPDNNTRVKSSWYGDYGYFANSSYPWFYRGGPWDNGSSDGTFAFSYHTGGAYAALSFRIVLAPTN